MLSNKFIEIGQEFGGCDLSMIKSSVVESKMTLLSYLNEELTFRYVNEFKTKEISILKNLLENEEWERIPIPDNFKLKEIEDPLFDYPKHMDTLLSVFHE